MQNLSHVKGPTTPRLEHVTISRLLHDTVSRFGSRQAIVSAHQGLRRSYGEFSADVDELAAGFLALGLEKGSSKSHLQVNGLPCDVHVPLQEKYTGLV